MNRPRLRDPLVLDGDYVSPNARPSLIGRLVPSFVFYSRIVGIVRRAFLVARKGRFDQSQLMVRSHETLRALERLGVRVTVENTEVLNRLDGPCVIVANHMSTLETFVLPGLVIPFCPMTFVVKKSLVEMPIFGPVMRGCDPIVVTRSDPRVDLKAMLNGGVDRISRGISIAVFPQTTRTVRFDPGSFNSIGAKLARGAGVPIVPLALRTDAWGSGRLFREIGPFRPELPVHFAFGEPMEVTGTGRAEHDATVSFINDNLDRWFYEVPPLA
jgi:1-acyl-sn-glycerol-3-phosphate acyltransferase